MITIEQAVGWSALVAAVATLVGAATLALFFQRGEPWGTRNDIASIVLMVATIPVALIVAAIERERLSTTADVVAAVGIVGMLAAAGLQLALVVRLRTYERLLGRTLAAAAVVGVWYMAAGVLGLDGGLDQPLPALSIGAGLGFIAVGVGFAAGAQAHPLAIGGGVLVLVASTAFLAVLGLRLVSGALVVPTWNA